MLSIFSWFGFCVPLPERLKMIKEAGFTATTLWWEDEVGYLGGEKKNFTRLVQEAGLILENIHLPYTDCNNFWHSCESKRNSMVDQCLAWLDECVKYEIALLVMHVTDGFAEPGPKKYGVESMTKIVRAAEELGIVIGVENTGRPEYVDLILQEIQSDYLGLCYDSSHDWLCSPSKGGLLDTWGHRLVATHFSDNDGLKDRHWLPGEGIIDWDKIGSLFPRETYRGFLALEVHPQEEDLKKDPRDFLARAYQSLLRVNELCRKGG